MNWNARMQALLDQTDMEEEDSLVDDLIHLETQLSIHELMLLLKVAAQGEESPWEPIDFQMWERDQAGVMTNVQCPMSMVVGLSEHTLRQLAGQKRLECLGMLNMRQENGWEYVLTPKGARAVDWWAGHLVEELGFQLPSELTTPTSPKTSSTPL